MKKLAIVLLLAAMAASLAFAAGGKEAAAPRGDLSGLPEGIASKAGAIRVAVIRNLGSDDHTNQFLAGAKEEGEALGFKVDTFITNGEDAKFQDFVNLAMNQKYTGIILSHGRDPYATQLVKDLVGQGIAVSCFDTAITGTVPGVTSTFQKDESLAEMSLGRLAADFDGKARILKLWVAGFPPMERRQVIYQRLLKEKPGIQELELIGAVSADVPGDTANKVGAALAKYPKGQIDAIWGSWDAFAQGAYKALKENGRTEIKLYAIDVSNQDLQLMQEPDSPWVCTAAVDPKLIGRINMRLVAKKIAGEPTPQLYEFDAALINRDDLKKSSTMVNMANLVTLIPGWGQSGDFNEGWMDALRAKYGKK
jgi:simple sugar transport system substrate-binding protein